MKEIYFKIKFIQSQDFIKRHSPKKNYYVSSFTIKVKQCLSESKLYSGFYLEMPSILKSQSVRVSYREAMLLKTFESSNTYIIINMNGKRFKIKRN